jgi:acetyl esterase/lipase
MNTDPPESSLLSASYFDIPYATQSRSQQLDLYLPYDGRPPYPVIMMIHGGGWVFGDKRGGIADFGEKLLPRGYAIVSINHRTSDEAKFPAQIQDAKAAVRWIRANAAEYGLDGERIIAWGGSSGGHLAAMLGTTGHVTELEDLSQGNADRSSRVNGVVDVAGPLDFLKMDAQSDESGFTERVIYHDIDQGPESRLIGGRISQYPERCRAANPMTYIRADNPPFYIRHSRNDPDVPYQQSVALAEALRSVIDEKNVKLDLSETGGHASQPEDIDGLVAFFRKHLG